jgi:hypothetical protein
VVVSVYAKLENMPIHKNKTATTTILPGKMNFFGRQHIVVDDFTQYFVSCCGRWWIILLLVGDDDSLLPQ